MTKLLYLEDSYIKETEASVIKADGKNVILDQTIFYPVGGGQPSDHGTLVCDGKQYSIINVKKINGELVHILDSEGLKENDKVTCILDWSRRYKFMRSHTACHLLSFVVHKETGALITGNQIGEEKCRVDFDLEKFDREKIRGYETEVNKIIKEEADITCKVLPRDEAFSIPSVLKLKNVLPPSIETIRIVDVMNQDIQACGGTHVKNTSEINGIEIIKSENKGKNNRRIYFILKD